MTHLNYFSQFGRMTDPGPFADLYADLPDDLLPLEFPESGDDLGLREADTTAERLERPRDERKIRLNRVQQTLVVFIHSQTRHMRYSPERRRMILDYLGAGKADADTGNLR